jgi:hypothetical protein
MSRDNVVQTRLSDPEFEVIETITSEMGCSQSEALRKCVRISRVYTDEELMEAIRSEEFRAVTKLMGD